jgi:2-methylcitrate dehydratase PrpD
MHIDDMVCDPRIQAVTERIKVLEDPALTAMLPDVRPARIEVELNNGTVLVERVDRPHGGFDRPFSEIELEKKFRRLAGTVLSEQSVSYLEDKLSTLPALKSISLLSTVLQGIQSF